MHSKLSFASYTPESNLSQENAFSVRSSRRRRWLGFIPIFMVLFAAWGATASANDAMAHRSHRHAEYPNLVGFRVGYLGLSEPFEGEREFASFVFFGLSYERTVIHEWLEIEVSVPLAVGLSNADAATMPMDLHFKIPFHPSPFWSPYVAVGPSVDVVLKPETEVFFGVSFAIGTYLWLSPQAGIDIEVDYNVLFNGGEQIREFLFAIGPVYRF